MTTPGRLPYRKSLTFYHAYGNIPLCVGGRVGLKGVALDSTPSHTTNRGSFVTFYNEYEHFAASWLVELQKDNQITQGIIDQRSITQIKGEELVGHERVHLFAGIGGWDYALQLAGWPADEPVWTGSCPCQPFSVAGKGRGAADERHLWPEMLRLIRECRPGVVFGEQVEGAVGKGWLDGVFADLEAEGYTCGACVLGAHSVSAPHIRQRLYWVAHTGRIGGTGRGIVGVMAGAEGNAQGETLERERLRNPADDGGADGGMVNSMRPTEARQRPERVSMEPKQEAGRPSNANPWAASEPILCADGKSRSVKPSIQPLAHGFPNRVGILRGSGNAIVPQTAAAFIMAYMESKEA